LPFSFLGETNQKQENPKFQILNPDVQNTFLVFLTLDFLTVRSSNIGWKNLALELWNLFDRQQHPPTHKILPPTAQKVKKKRGKEKIREEEMDNFMGQNKKGKKSPILKTNF
jgi:hypothetical protein